MICRCGHNDKDHSKGDPKLNKGIPYDLCWTLVEGFGNKMFCNCRRLEDDFDCFVRELRNKPAQLVAMDPKILS